MSIWRILGWLGFLAAVQLSSGCGPHDPRNRQPFAFDFETDADLDRVHWECGEIFSLSDTFATHGERGLRLEILSGKYPGLKFFKFDPDWSGYRALVFDVFNPQPQELTLHVRVDDRRQAPAGDRYNGVLYLPPGVSQQRLVLDSLRTRHGRLLRRQHIESVYLFLVQPQERVVLFFDYVRLEK